MLQKLYIEIRVHVLIVPQLHQNMEFAASVIITAPEGVARRCPYNYTRQQITCTHATMFQLTCIIFVHTSNTHMSEH